MITRQDYQASRLRCLKTFVDLQNAIGLEIGACDLPTVPLALGKCEYADFRSSDELAQMLQIPSETIVPVKYVINRNLPLHRQIDRKFDYIVLCHVIEHVPNVIGYIQSLRKLLKPKGIILIACPDKRRTQDIARTSTTIDHLLSDHYYNATYPAFDHTLESGRAWIGSVREKSINSPREFYEWACMNYESGLADTHCHVWTDEEFFEQIEYLIKGKILNGLRLIQRFPNDPNYNEFSIILQAVKHEELPKLKQVTGQGVPGIQLELSQVLEKLSEAQDRIAAMESSKFWQLRKSWQRIKRAVGLSSAD